MLDPTIGRMPLDCMTCMEMWTNGAGTGMTMTTIRIHRNQIHWVRLPVHIVCFAAGAGPFSRHQPTVAMPSRRADTVTWVSVSCKSQLTNEIEIKGAGIIYSKIDSRPLYLILIFV